MKRLRFFGAVTCLILTSLAATVSAQSTCSIPIAAFLTDDVGAPLGGSVDAEFRFYTDDAPDAVASECRTFIGAPVVDGWLRATVDSCGAPPVDSCGAVPINALLTGGSGDLFVGIVIDGTELEPRLAVGAVPFAVRAAGADDANTLDGLGPDAFEASGSIADHAADADAHHSSTSDGIEITPSAVAIGTSRLDDGTLDLGPGVDDALTAEMIRTLTGGGEADTLHTHAGHGGSAGAGGCYNSWGTEACAEGYTQAYAGVYTESITIWSTGVTTVPMCVADSGVSSIDSTGLSVSRFLLTAGVGGGVNEVVSLTETRMRCALCCP